MCHRKHIQNPIRSLERFLDLLLVTLIILMTLKDGASGACAACKYQRRRCAADCPLAPYFPAEETKLFQNVHRLFGVRSIVKILENLNEAQKPEAMKSIIFQSCIRDRYPIHGCLGVTQHLQQTILFAEEELKAVNSQLQHYRSQQHNQMVHEDVVTSQLDLGMGLSVNNFNFSPILFSETQQQQPQMYMDTNNDNAWCNESKSTNNGMMEIQSQQGNLDIVSNKQKEEDQKEVGHEYDDEIHQFLEIMDDRQSFSESKEIYASSLGESLMLKEVIDEMGDKELRNAATCFSLTSVN